MGKSSENILNERINELLNVEKLIAISLDYVRKMIRSLHYNNGSYQLPIPSKDEGDDICYRLDFLRKWDDINGIITNKKNESLNKLSILDNKTFADIRSPTTYAFTSIIFDVLKSELKDVYIGNQLDPNSCEEFSTSWSIAKVFDMFRDIFSLIEMQLLDIEKSHQNIDGSMMTESMNEIISLKKYFGVIPNIVKFNEKSIVAQIKNCLDKGIFKEIFKRRMEGDQKLTHVEVNAIFEQYVKGGLEFVKSIQSIFSNEKNGRNTSAGDLLKEFLLNDL